MLCNFEDEVESDATAGPDFEVVSPTAHSCLSEFAEADMMVDNMEGMTQVAYSRDGVAVWPTRKRSIPGTVSLVKQGPVLFFQWLPSRQTGAETLESDGENEPDSACCSPVSQGQYAVHPLPLSDVKAIRKQTPKLGAHHITLIQTNGLTLGPFYFGSGGVRALFSCLKQNVVLSKSGTDASTYLINDIEDPLQRSLATLDSSLDLKDVLMIDPSHLATLPYGQGLQGCQGMEASMHGALFGRMREGMQRASQYARDSFMLPPKQPQPLGTGAEVCEKRKREDKAETGVGCFEMVDRRDSESMQSGLEQPCPPPLTQDEWFVFLDAAGRVVDEKGLRMRIFRAGVEPSIRKEVWKLLLGMYPAGRTGAHRHAFLQQRRQEYDRIKAQWTSITDCQAKRNSKWRERWSKVDKDVRRSDSSHPFFAGEDNQNPEVLRRILLSYSIYNFDLGYCQGMSDLAAPILYIMQDEALAFWCFSALMERMEANFSTDSTSMQAQLDALRRLVEAADPELSAFFEARDTSIYLVTYRWLLVHFKREFSFDEVLRLWEGIWSCPLTPHFHIYMCVAVLQLHRQAIMACGPTFDDLLSFCILLSGKIDLAKSMRRAEKIVLALGETGATCLQGL